MRDFRFNLVINEEVQASGSGAVGLGLTLHNDICLPYFLRYCTDEQRERWLPGIAAGTLITAIAMTEPGIGSDLASMATTALRDGDHYIVNGSKTFITNGINADLVITAVKTDPTQRHAGMSLLVLERGMDGFQRAAQPREDRTARARHRGAVLLRRRRAGRQPPRQRGRRLPAPRRESPAGAIVDRGGGGCRGTGCARVDARVRQGAQGLRPDDRLVPEHEVRAPPKSPPRSRWLRRFVDKCVLALNDERLSAEDAAMAKWWCTELQKRAVDRCLQLFGGYGYMLEYPIARAYADARITTIYGGTTEIMKEIIGRNLGL